MVLWHRGKGQHLGGRMPTMAPGDQHAKARYREAAAAQITNNLENGIL
jgi:hypothetical protein